MSKYLVIVESPTKEKTISKFLGADYEVKSSYGHIRDLPVRELGVDVMDGFRPKYTVPTKSKKVISKLKSLSKGASLIFLATDYDREGEAIAWHLQDVLKIPKEKVKRITFHEITKTALNEAVKNPREIDFHLVNSQQARRVLDRLVGYKLSPLLWRKVKRGLSAGRVQSVAVRLICDREDEIKNFKPQEYWSLDAIFKKGALKDSNFSAYLYSKDNKKYEKFDLKNKDVIDRVLKDLQNKKYFVKKIESKERKRSPLPPFITSTLQQDASRNLGFSASKTMKIAQTLYEGVELGSKGNTGLITYMRTDSLNIAETARKDARVFVEKNLGSKYLPQKPRVFKSKVKGAQEAHEAIRPTSVFVKPEDAKKYLTVDQQKLYNLIWRRFLSSQMADAVYDTMSVDISVEKYLFRATGRTLKFSGFLEIFASLENEEDKEKEGLLPVLKTGEELVLVKLSPGQHFTEPPPRYNEASLIRALEEHGIGRPSTYAPTINTILDRRYVRIETKRFYPTNLGTVVNSILKKHFSEIVDVAFTAVIEEELDKVAEGNREWSKVVGEFYNPFKVDLAKAEKTLKYHKIEPEKTDEICPKCGKPMVLRDGRRSRFLACSGFPDCKTTFSVDKNNNKIVRPDPVMTDQKCEKCGSGMYKRIGKRGPFLACSAFPKCRNIKKYIEKNVNLKQPENKKGK